MVIKEYKLNVNPIEIFNNFIDDDMCIFLDSQKDEHKLGRYSIIGSNPFMKIKSKNGKVEIFKHSKWKEEKGSSFEVLEKYLRKFKVENKSNLPFIGGALGYFSYDLFHEIENISLDQIDDIKIPDMYFGIYNECILIDNLEKKIYIIVQDFLDNSEERLKKLEKKAFKIKKVLNEIKKDIKVEFKINMTKEKYIKSIEKIKENIRMGNVYQINFTQRFQCNLNKSPYTLFNRLRKTNKAPFGAYLDYKDFAIVSSSPERFIRINGNKIDTRPIKGTIGRGKNIEEDKKNKNILINSKKDQSELLMIIDLERNDLGKISETGSVKVKDLFYIEEYATVFQQIANVEGILKKNISLREILNSTFPGGSITGAPKISAMKLIGNLEKTTRNIYTGAIGYLSFCGNMDSSIVIRTVLCKDNQGYYQVGGGIVWDSNSESEYEESLIKGKALREALEWKN